MQNQAGFCHRAEEWSQVCVLEVLLTVTSDPLFQRVEFEVRVTLR